MKKYKWLIVTGVLLVAIFIGLYFYLRVEKSTDFEPLIKEKLAELVSRASDGLYVLEMAAVEIDILASTITAKDVKLFPDSARMKEMDDFKMLPDDIFNVQLDQLLITGISPTDFINKKHIGVNQVILDTPNVTVSHHEHAYNAAEKDTTDFYSRIAPDKQSYSVKDFILKKMRFTYKNSNTPVVLKDVTARLSDIRIDSTSANDSSRFLFAKNASLYMNDYSKLSKDGLYHTTIDSISVDPRNKMLSAFELNIEPQYDKQAFYKKVDYLKERYDFHINKLEATDVDWWQLMNGEGISANELALTGGNLNVYMDRSQSLPLKNKVGNYPHQMLMDIQTPINLSLLRVIGLFVSYEEVNPKSGKPGTIEFHNTSGTISNITNISSVITNKPWMRVDAKTSFMNRGAMQAEFNFNLAQANNGKFTVSAKMGPMNGEGLNEASRGLALVEIKELEVDELKADISGDDNHGSGAISFAYHNLKIATLKEDDGKLKKRGLISFLANTFVVKRDGEKPPETYQVSYQRDPNRSFFNVIWQTISLGVMKAIKGK